MDLGSSLQRTAAKKPNTDSYDSPTRKSIMCWSLFCDNSGGLKKLDRFRFRPEKNCPSNDANIDGRCHMYKSIKVPFEHKNAASRTNKIKCQWFKPNLGDFCRVDRQDDVFLRATKPGMVTVSQQTQCCELIQRWSTLFQGTWKTGQMWVRNWSYFSLQ